MACVLFKRYGRKFSLPVHVRCGRSNKLQKIRVCGKIYPACEANDDTYSANSRLVLRRVAAAYCPHLSLLAKWRIAYQIRYLRYDFGTGSSLQKIKHFTWYLNLIHFRILAFLYFRASAAPRHVMFYLINKHPHRCHRLTSAGRCFITCDVTTNDGATLYVYVTIYAAIHCKDRSGRAPRLNPSALLLIVDCSFVTGS